MTIQNTTEKVAFDQFREEWLTEIEDAGLAPLDKGRRFASKLITQWLDVTTDDDDFVICDGSRDGGIDIAYLQRADQDITDQDGNPSEGDTWYIVQSKYGSAFSGANTIRAEGDKILATLEGENPDVNDEIKQLLQKLTFLLERESPNDRIVLVFATLDPIAENDRIALDDLKYHLQERISPIFDVEEVSLLTVWESIEPEQTLAVTIRGKFVGEDSPLLVGTVSLTELFAFLVEYKNKAGNLDQLYEKNVRRFLGNRRRINKGIETTLEQTPDLFGLYNNGITIVASDYRIDAGENVVTVQDPYVVNGCQTTRTIWQVLDSRLYSDGTPRSESIIEWKDRVQQGGLVTKIVKSEEANILDITRFTNSQNAVREQDFIALDTSFRSWADAMRDSYDIFLEIQRGGIESQKAWEKQHPEQKRYNDYVNAFDLIKVYGAGWLGEPGRAFSKNAPFLPNGPIYDRMITREASDERFGVRDLYAAYSIKCLADAIGFGRNAELPSRRQSRFLFYYVVVQMLRYVIRLTPQLNSPAVLPGDLTNALIKLSTAPDQEPLNQLAYAAVGLLDQYLTQGNENNNCAFNEASFADVHNRDLNGFLKADNLGRDNHSPRLGQLLDVRNAAFDIAGGRASVAQALTKT